ncbi:hypothetical protein C9I56_38980 [Paraburkholderia caribensis]|uniref:hypothetical protein n=1 Tax=Paraburkholderia caribensis TaxID=75105 RepID=UPI000D163F15|nr:hypothetical protein [Paraburkholderia caribensis]PTB23475.1 hypothetical protein C9I56_38980 [Paraburkholderia caribensis]
MPRHYSTTQMIERLSGLLGTNDLSDWEKGFVTTLVRMTTDGQVTMLTDKQIDALDQLHARHFA